jgi:hypothetical protein
MPTPITRAYVARVSDVNRPKRSIVAKITTSALDRYGTVIDARGIDRRNYDQARVVLWEHGMDAHRGALPIGRNDWIRPAIGPNGPELIAQTSFHTKESGKGDDFTEQLFSLYADGDMRAFSVRICPTGNCSPPTPTEIRDRPELADCVMCYRTSELAEYSAVAVPGNAECLSIEDARSIMRCASKGLVLPDDLVSQARAITVGQQTDDEKAPLGHYILHDDRKWYVLDAGHRIVSEHNSREEAETERDRLSAGKTTVDAHGTGGNDDTTTAQSVAASLPALPPLGGRSYADRQAEQIRQLNGLFRPEQIAEAVRDQIRLTKGKV